MDIARKLSKCTGNATTRPAVVADLDSGCLLSFACLGTDCLDVHVNHHFIESVGSVVEFRGSEGLGTKPFFELCGGMGFLGRCK